MRHKTLLLTLFALFLMSLPALAVEPVLTVGTAVYGTGTVTVPITLATNGASLTSVAVDISYDPNVLSKPVGVIGSAATAVSKALYDNINSATGDPAAVGVDGVLAPSLGTYRILIAGDTGPNAATNAATNTTTTIAGARTTLTDGEVVSVTFTMSGTATGALTLTSTPFVSDADGSTLVAQGVNRSTISLSQGWNLISLPIAPSQTAAATVLGSIPYRNIWGYTGGAWTMYDPADPFFSDLTDITVGSGYWIYATGATKLQVPGVSATKTLSLGSGWNMVGFNATAAKEVSQATSSISSKVDKIWAFQGGSWLLYDPSDPFFSDLTSLDPGKGYWIKMKEAGIWTLP